MLNLRFIFNQQQFEYNCVLASPGRSVQISSLTVVGDAKTPNQPPQNKSKFNGGRGANPIPKDMSTSSQETVPKFINIEDLNNPPAPPLKPVKVNHIRPVVVCGITITGRPTAPKPDSHMIIEDMNFTSDHPSTCLCLVVYDFQYTKDVELDAEPANKKPTPSSKSVSNIVISMMHDIEYELMDPSNSSEAMTFIDDMNYQALKMLKQTESNNYQNLIPGESDDIFLPPPTNNQSESGTRVLVVDETEEPDASSSLIATNYQFMNGQLNSPTEAANNNVEKSISDHISELKSSKNKKLNYSHAVQCFALPAPYKNDKSLEIFEIVPTRDGHHLLVVLRSVSGDSINVLLVYALCFTGSVVRVNDKPVLVRELSATQCPVEVSIIPAMDKLNTNNADGANSTAATSNGSCIGTPGNGVKPALDGSAVIVCVDGVVRVFDLATLKPTCVAKLEAEKFVSAVYCNSK